MILEKINEKGSLRWTGETYQGLSPKETIIASVDVENIINACNFVPYKLGRYSLNNILVTYDGQHIFYVFVNPNYKNYKKAFQKLIGPIPMGYHVDHALAKNLATHLGYKYILLCLVTSKVNIRHGQYEKMKLNLESNISIPKVCFADDRIFDKILSRSPTARREKGNINIYTPIATPTYGLSLKQQGTWNSAFGFDRVEKSDLLSMLKAV